MTEADVPEAPTGLVTLVFTDIQGSTSLWERAPEAMRGALALHDGVMRRLLGEFGGYEVKTEGDAFMVAFGDPTCAVRWCLAAQVALHEAPWDPSLPASGGVPGLCVRMGAHVGRPECRVDGGTGRMDYFGPPVNRAARASAAAHGGQVVITGELWEAARDALNVGTVAEPLGEFRLKGIDDDVVLIQVAAPALAGRVFPPIRALAAGQNRPYRGLDSFDRQHAALFYGREREVEELSRVIRDHGLVTVTGPSGVGKSSLVQAGVATSLTGWSVARLRPGQRPVLALETALVAAVAGWRDDSLVRDALRAGPALLGGLLARWSREASAQLLVVVDQAEELLTLATEDAERVRFGEAFCSIADSGCAALRVVVVVREDFFGRLATVSSLRGRYNRVVEVVAPPERDQLERALVEPAAMFGYRYEDAALVATLVDPIVGKPAAFALLSFCADRLWDARDRTARTVPWSAYHAVGGTVGALAAHADRTLVALPPNQQRLARGILLRLVTAEGTRTAATPDELAGDGDPELVRAVLDALATSRLVVYSEQSDAVVELVHEALVQHWDRLRGWIAEDQEGLRLGHALRDAAREWSRRERPPGLLWTGDRLDDLRRRPPDSLAGLDAEFAEASVRRAAAAGRRKRAAYAAGLAVSLAVTALSLTLWRSATVERAVARANEAVAMASLLHLRAGEREATEAPTEALALMVASVGLLREAGQPVPVGLAGDIERVLASFPHEHRLGEGRAYRRVVMDPQEDWVAAWGDSELVIWGVADGSVRNRIEVAGEVRGVQGSEDGRFLLWSEDGGGSQISVREGGSGVVLWQVDADAVQDVALASGGHHVAVVQASGRVRVWSVDAAAVKDDRELPATESRRAIAVSRDGQFVLVAQWPSEGAWWFAVPGGAVREVPLRSSAGRPAAVGFSPDGLAWATSSEFVRRVGEEGNDLFYHAAIWDPSRPGEVSRWSSPERAQKVVTPSARLLVVRGTQGAVATIGGRHTDTLGAIACAGSLGWEGVEWLALEACSGTTMARNARLSVGTHGRVAWVEQNGVRLTPHPPVLPWPPAPFEPANGLLALNDGWLVERRSPNLFAALGSDLLPSQTYDRSNLALCDWRAEGGLRTASAGACRRSTSGFSYMPENARAGARFWGLHPDGSIADRTVQEELGTMVRVVPEGRWLGIAADGTDVMAAGEARASNAETTDGRCLRLYGVDAVDDKRLCSGPAERVVALELDSDGRHAAVVREDAPDVELWDLSAGTFDALPGLPTLKHGQVVIAPDGRRVAVADATTLRITAPGATAIDLGAPTSPPTWLSWSPDGRWIAGGARGARTLDLWDTAGNDQPMRLDLGSDTVNPVVWSSDGRLLALVVDAGARVYDAATGHIVFDADADPRFRAGGWTFEPMHVNDIALREREALLLYEDGSLRLVQVDPPDLDRSLPEAARTTNLRVCRDTFDVVAVEPFPTESSPWAAPGVCQAR